MSDQSKTVPGPGDLPDQSPTPSSDLKERVADMLRRSEKFVKDARELGRGLSKVSDQDLKIRLR